VRSGPWRLLYRLRVGAAVVATDTVARLLGCCAANRRDLRHFPAIRLPVVLPDGNRRSATSMYYFLFVRDSFRRSSAIFVGVYYLFAGVLNAALPTRYRIARMTFAAVLRRMPVFERYAAAGDAAGSR